jgi:transposase InsO family protein
MLPLSRASYYRFRKRPLGLRAMPWNRSPAELERLVYTIRAENPAWGKLRIALALMRLGVYITPNTVRNILLRPPLSRTPRRRRISDGGYGRVEASRPHALWSLDFTKVKILGLFPVQAFAVLDHASRKLLLLKAVRRPGAAWVCGQLEELFRSVAVPQAILSDRGCEFTAHSYRALLKRHGVADKKCRVRRPQTNGKMERFFQSLKHEFLNALFIRGPGHLDVLLDEYREYYNRHRPHQAFGGLTPQERMDGTVWKSPPRRAKAVGAVQRFHHGGEGLLNSYKRAA